MKLPKVFDLTPSGKVVSRADIGTGGYIDNVEYNIRIDYFGNSVQVSYCGDDGTVSDQAMLMQIFPKKFLAYAKIDDAISFAPSLSFDWLNDDESMEMRTAKLRVQFEDDQVDLFYLDNTGRRLSDNDSLIVAKLNEQETQS